MSDSEQQDILDGLIHIYECDEQQVSALIVPTDGEIRENLPVSIEDADSDTVYTTTTTDANGMINTTFSLSPGTHTPIVKCGNDTHNIYDAGVVCHACSLTLTSDKDILSAADNDVATLTATLMGTESGYDEPLSDREITFEIYKASDDTLIETQTATTNSNGLASVSYYGKGAGDIYIKAECRLLIQTFVVQDCIDTILGDTDQSSKFGSSIGLRNNGTSSISYDSTNKYYILNITKSSSESFIPINNVTGLDDVIIEFDGYLPVNYSFLGLCFYKENSNWGRLGTKQSGSTAYEYGGNTNGTYAETDITGSTPPSNTWLHHKFTITNDTVHRQVYNGETLIYEDTRTYTGFFTSTTKYGFTALWDTIWKGYYKNIKIKPL